MSGRTIDCGAMRWKIPGFLNGNLPAEMMEDVREHLDICPDCAAVLAHPARVEGADCSNLPPLPEDFTEKLMARLPASFTGQKLAGFVALGFFASGVFGVAIWAAIEWLLGEAGQLAETMSATPAAENTTLYQTLFSSSSLQYLALGVLAVIICLVVIAIVDRPRDEDMLRNES